MTTKIVKNIYIASDSTAQTYKIGDTPRGGWGQYLQEYLPTGLEVINKAIGGRSSRSFIEEGRLDNILEGLKEGDYLLIQFGHNDASSDKPERYVAVEEFGGYINRYIQAALEKKAIPVLLTPVAQRYFDQETQRCDISFPKYRETTLRVAEETDTQVIDLGQKSADYMTKIGVEESKKLFFHIDGGIYPNFPEKVEDNTHFQVEGAREIAKIIAGELQKLNIY